MRDVRRKACTKWVQIFSVGAVMQSSPIVQWISVGFDFLGIVFFQHQYTHYRWKH
jgi:hypothetical protein